MNFELVTVRGTIAVYRFGECLKELNGEFEVDLPGLIHGDISMKAPICKVVILKNRNQSQAAANKVFGKIYKYFLEHYEYPTKGGYYA
ncbi:hypothetical protein [Cohnella abietis]|uniref:hypothetical protein n=1 Tax=Cohnella abietis TaxID=2507935 RepID=UPI001E4AEDD7|nr:hypothetical protein [Cohnella abietis]